MPAVGTAVLMTCTLLMTVSVNCRKLHIQCGQEESLIQKSAYDKPYFNTSNGTLLLDSLQNSPIYCMWKKSCIKNVKMGTYKTKKKWYRQNMRCLKKDTTVLDLISNGQATVRSLDQTVIVRSHKDFPWNYQYCYNKNYNLVFKTGEHHLQKYHIVVDVLISDINDNDIFDMTHDGKSVSIPRGSGIRVMNVTNLESVRLTFNLSRSMSTGCQDSRRKGFLLCIKLAETSNHNGICDDVMKKVNLCSPKSKSKKRRNKCRKTRRRRGMKSQNRKAQR